MLKHSRMVVLLLLVLVVTLLAACGGGNKESDEAAAAAAPPATATPAGDADKGKEIFNMTCLACHGEGGVGVPNLGKDMTVSTFIHESSDEDLLAFIKKGRDPGDPANTTGVSMPSKGGNPALSDEDLMDVIAYIRTLNANAE
jgi:disulfide bond formation protein DsbB